ncbi:hypothetical protein H1W00_10770 [Aeromicrobium sp. Marseille-Q0843]|uniref:Uncharacterized protein n=1 Tax=Aeromicrobium phoceense TaxID=2754045 RepID=A0A838XJL0_9ACTN|nr:hypothetical protein [Aeromicrobium phoceense]MBA4608958.1 hypothetical protein [Aeromicrobium phoceense]
MVDLDLSVHPADRKPTVGIPVATSAWLVISESVNLTASELPHVLSALRRVAPRLQERYAADSGELIFTLDHLWYPLTDSQDDAIELAVAGWAVEQLGIDADPARVTFDRAANAYVITFDKDMWKSGRG